MNPKSNLPDQIFPALCLGGCCHNIQVGTWIICLKKKNLKLINKNIIKCKKNERRTKYL